jgi:hypothetical protein
MLDELNQIIHDLLVNWLHHEDWQGEQLIRWSQYYDFPPVGHDEEPYKWLLRALHPGEKALKAKLAQRLAAVLEARPDVKRPGKRPEQVLYNLLLLSAGLKQPEQLAEPLFQILKRRTLDGQWSGVQLRSCLRAALIENQIDKRLQPAWEDMLYKRGHKFLKGNKYDGYQGIISMPQSAEILHEPDLDAIGKAVKVMAESLEGDDNIRPELRHLIKAAMEKHPEHQSWELDLFRQADKHHWPPLAVECLPTLCIRLQGGDEGRQRFILWRDIFSFVKDTDGCIMEKEFCRGHGYQALLPHKAVHIVTQVAPPMEKARLNNPFPTIGSSLKVGINVMAEIESEIKENDPEVAKTLEDSQQKALAKVLSSK